MTCPVYRREQLGAGAEIVGPALIQEHGTTTVLFARDRCRVAPGELIIQVGARMTGRQDRTSAASVARGSVGGSFHRRLVAPMTAKLDPVTLEVIRNALPAVANEMASTCSAPPTT